MAAIALEKRSGDDFDPVVQDVAFDVAGGAELQFPGADIPFDTTPDNQIVRRDVPPDSRGDSDQHRAAINIAVDRPLDSHAERRIVGH